MSNRSKMKDPRAWKKCRESGGVGNFRMAQDAQVERFRQETGISAVVRDIDGQLVLDDPEALAVIRVMAKRSCRSTLDLNMDRVEHFKVRMTELGKTSDDVVIVVLNVDDIYGGQLAEVLMPGFNWQEIRDQGEIPFARGLAEREGVQFMVKQFDYEAAAKSWNTAEATALVVDHGVAEVYSV